MVVKHSAFPLFENDGKPCLRLTHSQKEWVSELKKAISNRELNFVQNHCLCGNENVENDIVVSEKDRYGLPIRQILCSKCGLIRSEQIFDEKSNFEFYKTYYRPIYTNENPTEEYFNQQVKRGVGFLKLINEYVGAQKIKSVVEIGCGSGGVLMPFKENGQFVSGYDYGKEFLELGISKGLDLYSGGYEDVEDEAADLIILSHVMEHFLNPIEEMSQIIKKIKPNKYLIVEVPGLFWQADTYFNPITYFQNAHVFNYFYYNSLKVFFENLGLKIIYGNERTTFICQKPENWNVKNISPVVWDDSLEPYPQKVADYLMFCKKKYKLRMFDLKWLKHFSFVLICKIGLLKN